MSKETEKHRAVFWWCIPWAIVAVIWAYSLVASNTNTNQLEHRAKWIRSVQEHLGIVEGSRWTYEDQCNFAEINELRMPAGKHVPRELPVLPPEALGE